MSTTSQRRQPGRDLVVAGWAWLTEPGDRPTRADRSATAIALVVMLAAVILRSRHAEYPGAERLVFTVLAWLPLLVRTRWPGLVLVATLFVEALQLIVMRDQGADIPTAVAVAAYQPVPVATMLAVYTVATRRPQQQGWLTASAVAGFLAIVALLFQPLSLWGTDLVMVELVVLAAVPGVISRSRQDQRLRRARSAADNTRQAVIEERLRIARELHDALAHNLTLINAQAGVADYLMTQDPESARAALWGITTHTSAAIDDLRGTIGLLRRDGDPAHSEPRGADDPLAPLPGVRALGSLLDRFRAAGVEVVMVVYGEPFDLPQQVDLAVYRIVQEAVTNAAKHASGAEVAVAMTWTDAEVGIAIHNAAGRDAVRPPATAGTGHGLIGMRERALAVGGTFRAGATADGGFAVAARLPVPRRRHRADGDIPPEPDRESPERHGAP
ncbi:sensor histidine kinase [Flexivirga alba]|uniref:histidine kinase n=1 Tax=Flexivirga alba TaxID=702742 RepID=A0ABW2ACN1_9MICO